MVGPADNFYSLTDPRLTSVLSRMGNVWQGMGSAAPTLLSMNTPADYMQAWNQCPPLVAIICNIAQADINGKVRFFKPGTDEEVGSHGNNLSSAPLKALRALFSKPNSLQTWRQFRAQQKIYVRLFGICPVLMVRPEGMDTPKMMWNIPPHLVKVETTGKLFYQTDAGNIIKSITVTLNGKDTPLPVDDVIFLRDQTVSLTSEILPDSRLKTIQRPISNIVACYDAENTVVTKRGALGIFSNAAAKDTFGQGLMQESEKEQLQADLRRYGLSQDQYQYIITTAAVTWQQVGVNIKELMLIEIIKSCTETMCDVLGYKFELMANEKGTTFANQEQALASFYQDTIIPEASSDMDVYNAYFEKMGITGIEARMMFDHVEVLQQSEEERAKGRKAINEACKIEWDAGKLTLNNWAEQLGDKKLAGEQFDMYKPQYDNWLREQGMLPPLFDPNKINTDEPAATA